jgi:precorrin-4 methylase
VKENSMTIAALLDTGMTTNDTLEHMIVTKAHGSIWALADVLEELPLACDDTELFWEDRRIVAILEEMAKEPPKTAAGVVAHIRIGRHVDTLYGGLNDVAELSEEERGELRELLRDDPSLQETIRLEEL